MSKTNDGEAAKLASALLEAEQMLSKSNQKSAQSLNGNDLRELQDFSSKIKQAAEGLRGLPQDMVKVAEQLQQLLLNFQKSDLFSGERKAAASDVKDKLALALAFVSAMGIEFFTGAARAVSKRKTILVAVLVALFVFVAVGTGIAGFVIYKRQKKKNGAAAGNTISSKKGKSGAYEINSLTNIYGAPPAQPDLASITDVCSYTLLVNMNDVDEANADTRSLLFRRKYQPPGTPAPAPANVIEIECHPKMRQMRVQFRTQEAAQAEGTSFCTFIIDDLPLYKWFVVHVVVNSTNAKLYINGSLVRNFYLHTCGFIVHAQKGEALEFPQRNNNEPTAENAFVKLRYFKAHPGELDELRVRGEAMELLKEVNAEKEQAVRDKCKTVSGLGR